MSATEGAEKGTRYVLDEDGKSAAGTQAGVGSTAVELPGNVCDVERPKTLNDPRMHH